MAGVASQFNDGVTGATARTAINQTIENAMELVILTGQTAGYGTTAAGDVVYLSDIDGKWEKVDADAEATSKGLVGVALNAVAEDATTLQVQIGGIYTTTGLTAGDVYYLSTTLGGWTNTAPSGTGDIVRVIGFALSSTEMLLMQDQTYIEIEAQATTLLFGFACSDETTALTTGEKVATDVPGSCVVTRVYASCTTAPTHTTTALVVDVEDEGTTILNAASELTFATTSNNKEATSFASAASSYAFTKGDLLTIDVDSVGDGTAGAGLKVYFFGYWT